MTDRSYSAFDGSRLLASGPLLEVTLAVKAAPNFEDGTILTFNDQTGKVVDLDFYGTPDEIAARHRARAEGMEARGRGRPKLGVIPREVTLLPRHWDWLAAQRGGASVTLRRLIDEARKADGSDTDKRARRDAIYAFMSAIAGNLPGFEEATRALYAGDEAQLEAETAGWPADFRAYLGKLGSV